MAFPKIGARTEEDVNRQFATEAIDPEAGGSYILQVTSAYDSYAVNPEDVENPERKRYIHVRVESVDVRRTRGKDFSEDDESLNARRSEIGKYADVYIRLDRRAKPVALEGRLSLLCNIAGTTQQQFEDALNEQGLLQKAYIGTERGQDGYDMGMIAEEVHVNCSQFMGRLFGGVLEFREHEGKTYVDINPWQHFSLADQHQRSFKGETLLAGDAFSGEDTASAEAKERFAARKEKTTPAGGDGAATRRAPRVASNSGMKTADTTSENYDFSPDDDLPF